MIPFEDTKILEFIPYQKFHADFECLVEKIDGCKNNPEISYTTKAGEYIPSGFSMSTSSSFKSIENKHDLYRAKDCMKSFCRFLREYAMQIFYFKKMKLLTNKQQKSYANAKVCYNCKENLEDKHAKDKGYCKVRDHCNCTGKYSGAVHSVCNLKYCVPKEIPTVFHNRYTYKYPFIIKELAEECEGQFTCLVENTKKYINFSVPIEKK